MTEKMRDGNASSRRDFLKLAATAAPAAAAATFVGGAANAEVQPATSLGLKKTEHVKKYLDSARF